MIGAEQNATSNASPRKPVAVHGAFAAGVAVAVSAAMWFGFAAAPVVGAEDLLVRGVLVALALWLLATVHAGNAAATRREAERLEVAQSETSLLTPDESADSGPAIGGLSPTAAVLGAVALAGAVALRFAPAVQEQLDQSDLRILGAGAVAVAWILALGAGWGWWRATALRLRREGAESNGSLAQSAMARLPVMISLCAPDGRRLACNDRFAEVFKRSPDDLDEGKWREFVHQTDRSSFDAVFERDPGGFSPVAVEYGVTTPGGDNRWVREQFLPERVHGVLHGYIAVGVDITSQVRNEAEYVEQLDALKEAEEKHALVVGRLEEERDAARQENDELKSLLRTESQRSHKQGASLEKAREQRDKAKADLKEIRAERTALKSENSRLSTANTRMEKELEAARAEAARLAELQADQAERLKQYKSEAEESRRQESQLRTKVKRLTEEAQGQAEQIDALTQARDDAEAAAHDLTDRLDAEVADASRAALAAIGARADAAAKRIAEAIASAPDDAGLDPLESSMAIIRSIHAGVDGSATEPSRERAFDLRAMIRDAADITEALAGEDAPRIDAEVEPEFPATVYGDSYRLRASILQMACLLAGVPEADSLTLRLAHFGTLPSMASVRIEFVLRGATLDADAVGQSMAPGGTVSDETADAWRRFATAGSEHGAEAADPHTLTVWLKTTVMRRMTGADDAPPMSAPALSDAPRTPDADEPPPLSPRAVPAGSAPAVEPPRIPQEDHECNLGAVLELGQTTARIRSTRALSGNVVVRFTGADGKEVEAPARIESSEKSGARKFDTLLRFVDLPAQTTTQLRKIALMNRRLTMFVSRDEPAA